MKKSSLLLATTLVAGSAVMTGCLDKGGVRGQRGDGSNSVVAAIEGITDEDLKREGMKYWLACDGNVRVQGTPKADRTAVEFPSENIKNEMVCSMEIGISEDEGKKLDWEWFGRLNGKPVVGLMYGSSKDKVVSKALQLKLYRVYSPKSGLSFKADLKVSFDVADAAQMPIEDKAIASLVCGETESFPGTYKKDTDKNAVLSFANLKVKDLKGRACKKVAVLVDNKEAFAGDVDVAFEDSLSTDPLTFPKDATKRYVLKASEVDGKLNVGLIPAGICSNLETSTGVCNDVRSVDLPVYAKHYLVAKVTGLTADGLGEKITFFVGAGSGFGLYEGSKLDIVSVNQAARSAAGSDDRKAFSFYRSKIQDNLYKAPFNADFIAGKDFAADFATEEDLNKVMLVHIEDLRVHGMHTVKAEDLNKLDSAYWLALVTAKKDAESKEFIATGFDKYFHSASAPATQDSKPAYLNTATLVADMAAITGPSKYRSYAISGGLMAEATCKEEKSAYFAGLSQRHMGNLKPDGGVDAAIDACAISGDKFTAAVGTGYTFEASLYRFGWHVLTK